MKLNFLSAGRLRMKKSVYVPSADRSDLFDLPVSSALIRHKQGNVLFDSGCHPSVVDYAEERWGSLAKVMKPVMSAQETLLPSLACVGPEPDDIDVVVNSHLHTDHCGCNEFFRKATILIGMVNSCSHPIRSACGRASTPTPPPAIPGMPRRFSNRSRR